MKNKSVIIIGGGYSVKEGIEKGLWERIRGREIWSINYAFKTMPYLPSKQLWSDVGFLKRTVDDLNFLYEHGVELITNDYSSSGIYSFLKDLYRTKHERLRDEESLKSVMNELVLKYFKKSLATCQYTERSTFHFLSQLLDLRRLNLKNLILSEGNKNSYYLIGNERNAKNHTVKKVHIFSRDTSEELFLLLDASVKYIANNIKKYRFLEDLTVSLDKRIMTGLFTLSLATSMEYKTIFLLGYDFGVPRKNCRLTHYYQDQAEKFNIESSGLGNPYFYYDRNGRINRSVYKFKKFSKMDAVIYNVSPLSNIPYFTKISYDEFINLINDRPVT